MDNLSIIKEHIRKYISISEELDSYNKLTKDLRAEKKKCEDVIREHMLDNGHDIIDLKVNGKLKITRNKINKKLGKKDVLEALLEHLKSEEQSEKLVDLMFPEDEKEVVKLQHKKDN